MPNSSSLPEIALITSSVMPKPDRDTALLVEELGRLGVRSSVLAWDAPVPWGDIPMVVLRTPWDYVPRCEEFMRWATEVDAQTVLLNPLPLLRWNVHKGYLLELAVRDVPVVPTELFRRNEAIAPGELRNPTTHQDKDAEVVLKPAVSSGARGAMRGRLDDPTMKQHFEMLQSTGDVLLQPFVPGVALHGEVSLVHIEGEFTHAIRKIPAPGDYRVQDQHGGVILPHTPTPRERDAASAALGAIPVPSVYARVDLVEWEGQMVVMEIELIEPELFLRYASDSTGRFAHCLRHRLRP